MKTSLTVFMFVVFASPAFSQVTKMVTYGKYAVGFHSSLEFDYSRPARNKNQFGRAVQVNIWYPAETARATKNTMNFREYLELIGSEDDAAVKRQSIESLMSAFLETPAAEQVDMQVWNKFLSGMKPMKGVRNAPFKKHEYPVIQLLHGSAVTYCVMGEYLASHGMIVVSVPYKGYLQNSFDVNLQGMETEIRDNEFAFDVLVRKFGVTPANTGLVGLSFGGQSAVGLAVRNPRAKGIVSLDGGIGSSFGPQLLSGLPSYTLEKVNIPILHLYNPADRGGNLDWFGIAQYNDRYLIGFNNMDHGFFGINGLLENELPFFLGSDKPRPGNNYEAILLYTLTFFNHAFGIDDQKDSVMKLDEEIKWIQPTIQSKEFRQTLYRPLPLSVLREILKNKGIQAMLEERQRLKQTTAMPISDGSYKALFLDTFGLQDKQGMLALSEYYEIDFPKSAFAKYYRARALQANGDVEGSIKYFKECLDLIAEDKSMTAVEKETVNQRVEGFLKK